MTSPCRRPALAVALAAAVLVAAAAVAAGCGVRPSGVVGAGEPVRAQTPVVQVYFVRGNELWAVGKSAGSTSAESALQLLADGPGPTEYEAGIGTELPEQLRILAVDIGKRVVFVDTSPNGLSELARRQIACTVRDSEHRDPSEQYTLTLTGKQTGDSVPAVC